MIRTTTAVLSLAAISASAQRPVPLAQSTGKVAEPFSEIVAVHELSDGRLMLIDNVRAERTVWYVDFRDGTQRQFGRRGRGPGEYLEPTSILPLGDSLLLVDPLAQRVIVLSRGGDVLRTGQFPRAVSGGSAERRWRKHPAGIDTQGRFYYEFEVFNPDRTGPTILALGGIARSSMDRANEELMAPWTSRGPDQSTMERSNVVVWPLRDGWSVRSDGLVARVVAQPFEVRWYRDGKETGRAVPLPAGDYRVTDADRRAYIDYWDKVPVMGMGQNGPTGPTGRKNPLAEHLRDHPESFPARRPPLAETEPNVMFDKRGRLWIVRDKPARDSSYAVDIVDEASGIVGRVVLPARRRLVGIGANALYLVRVDDDDLQWLERYPLPM